MKRIEGGGVSYIRGGGKAKKKRNQKCGGEAPFPCPQEKAGIGGLKVRVLGGKNKGGSGGEEKNRDL